MTYNSGKIIVSGIFFTRFKQNSPGWSQWEVLVGCFGLCSSASISTLLHLLSAWRPTPYLLFHPASQVVSETRGPGRTGNGRRGGECFPSPDPLFPPWSRFWWWLNPPRPQFLSGIPSSTCRRPWKLFSLFIQTSDI